MGALVGFRGVGELAAGSKKAGLSVAARVGRGVSVGKGATVSTEGTVAEAMGGIGCVDEQAVSHTPPSIKLRMTQQVALLIFPVILSTR